MCIRDRYLPPHIVFSEKEWGDLLREVISQETVDETYIRNFINCHAFDKNGDVCPMNKLQFIYDYGSKKAKQITVDEKLSIK